MLLTSALFSLGSCEDTTDLGVGLPGTTDINAFYEDFAAQAYTVRQDSLPTTQKDHFLFGSLVDGNTRAALTARPFLEVAASPDSLPSQFIGQNPVLDSMVMFINVDRVYGSAPAHIQLSATDLQRPLDDFTPYSSVSSLPTAQTLAPNQEVLLNRRLRNKAGTLDSLNLPIRLPYSSTFASMVFNKLTTTTGVTLTDQQLHTFWNGISLATATPGTVVAANRSVESVVNVYYHITVNSTATKKKVYRFLYGDPFVSASAPRYFTNISYDLRTAGSPFDALQSGQAAQVSAAASNGTTYVQNGTGLMTKLVIPGLDVLRDRQTQRNIVINRAELLIPVKTNTTGQFTLPGALYIFEANAANRILYYQSGQNLIPRAIQSAGNIIPVLPSSVNPNPELPLTLTDASPSNKFYTALITNYVQAYTRNQLSGTMPDGFLLMALPRRSSDALNLNRAALDGQNIKLRVYYSNAAAR